MLPEGAALTPGHWMRAIVQAARTPMEKGILRRVGLTVQEDFITRHAPVCPPQPPMDEEKLRDATISVVADSGAVRYRASGGKMIRMHHEGAFWQMYDYPNLDWAAEAAGGVQTFTTEIAKQVQAAIEAEVLREDENGEEYELDAATPPSTLRL